MDRPRLLDTYCKAGGATRGYQLAGFHVTGVDLEPQPRYCGDAFIQADALEYIREHGHEYDAIHASPPCQDYSVMRHATGRSAPRLIAATRDALESTGRPYVIENVEGARSEMRDYVTLCGTMFGLRVRRHRLFELHAPAPVLLPPCTCRNGVSRGELIGQRVAGRVLPGRTKPPHHTEADRREAIGVPWMTARAARQAIPPAYTEYIGRFLIHVLESKAA